MPGRTEDCMPTVTAKYLGNLRVQCTHERSGTAIITDAPVDNKGKGEAFSPTDLVASGLGACAMTIMAMTAEAHHINVEGMRMDIEKIMSANPRRIGEIVVRFVFAHACSEKEQTLLRRAADTCPVKLTLHPDVKQVFEFVFP